MKHVLHTIGYIGGKRAYLDIPLSEAKRLYREAEEYEGEFSDEYVPVEAPSGPGVPFKNRSGSGPDVMRVDTIQFDDEFCVYDAWEK
jgi:hypothetical protein